MAQLEAARKGATVDDMRPYFPSWTEEQLRLRADWLGTCDEEAVRETWHNFHREDFFPYLKWVRPPALFMYGGESPVVTAEAIPEIEETNPEVELVKIAGAGHMIPWDNYEDFRSETARFLAAAG
jgi:N-formylmaleamate deformylase